MSQKSTKKLICLYQKGLINNREKLQKLLMSLIRVDTMAKQECFITLKVHKEDYRTNPKYHLLNPTKSQLGKISKQMLQKINKTLSSK